jgi:hypothetical protein
MISPAPCEGEQMRAWFEGTQNFAPERNAWDIVIPFLSHEGQAVRRVCHAGVNVIQERKDFAAIA